MDVVHNPSLTEFDRKLAEALLAGSLDFLAKLRVQFESARTVSRTLSGAGFFLSFAVPETAGRVFPPNFELSDVFFEAEGLAHGGGSVLFVRDGVITTLEAYSHVDDWPDEITAFTIRYFDGDQRDMSALSAAITARSRLVTSGNGPRS